MLVVGVLETRQRLRASHSLKEKRRVVRSILQRIRARFNVSVAEVDDQDLWQSISLGFAAAGSDSGRVVAELEKVLHVVRTHPEAEFLDHDLEII